VKSARNILTNLSPLPEKPGPLCCEILGRFIRCGAQHVHEASIRICCFTLVVISLFPQNTKHIPCKNIGQFFLLILRCLQGLCSDRHGRKKLSLIGNGIICVSIVLYTVMVGLQYLVHWFSYISIVASFGEFVLGSLKPSECTTKTLLLYINIILGGFFIVKFLPGVPKIMTSKISVIVCCYI